MIKNGLVICILICFVSFGSYTQNFPDTLKLKNYESVGNYVGSYFVDGVNLVKAPFKWQKKDWILAGSAVVAGSLIYIFDDDIRDLIQRNRSSFTNNFSENFVEPFGSGMYSLPLLGLLYITGEASQNSKSKTIALNGVKTFVFSATFATVLKQITKRHRPYQDLEANSRLWDGPFGNSNYSAFPSGHTMVSFALASYISSEYKDKLWVGISTYTIASLVGLSRINDDKHWASDVFFGAVLGYAVGKCIFNNSFERHNIQILPLSQAGFGLTLIKKL